LTEEQDRMGWIGIADAMVDGGFERIGAWKKLNRSIVEG